MKKKELSSQTYNRIYPILVTQIYNRSNFGIMSTLVTSSILIFTLRNQILNWILIAWFSMILFVSLIRICQNIRFLRTPDNKKDIRRWGQLLTVGVGLSGIVWGSSAIFLFPINSVTHQVFIAFMLAGMVAGAVGLLSSSMPVFLSFSIPTVTPIIVRFFVVGDDLHMAMSAMTTLFVILTFTTARRSNKSTIKLVALKENYADQLKKRTIELEQKNELLGIEVEERQQAEQDLKKAKDELEFKIDERTAELSIANRHLTEEINERKKAESALKISEERYRNLFENTGTATFVIEEDFTISQVNTKCEKLSGYSRQEILGKMKATDFVMPEDLARVIDYHHKRREAVGAALPEYELGFVDKSGNVKTLFIEIGLIPGTKQSIASLIDITLRKQAEESLRESEDKFNRAFMLGPDIIAISRMKDGKYIDVNDNLLEICGYHREEVIGKTDREIKIWDNPNDRELFLKKLDNEGRVDNFETDFKLKSGSLIQCLVSARPLEIKGEKCIISITRDIRERKQAEKKKRKLETYLQQARKMEAVGVLAGGIAHEFNNALTVVAGNIELLQLDLPGNENVIKFGQIANTSVRRMSNLTNQLLAYARGGKYRPENINLSDFVKDTLAIMKHEVGSEISIQTDLPNYVSHINADLTQLQTILSVIVTNSIEALEGEGHIRVNTGDAIVGEKDAGIFIGLKAGRYAYLAIQDDGKGMDEETKSRIFEPFFTTKFQGRGLGMAAVYGIVKNHDGYIYIDSEPGKGTTIRIFLPSVEVIEKEAKLPEPELRSGAGTILVIEDEEMISKAIQTMLEKFSYRVLCANTGEKAISIAKSYKDNIDLALLDIKMPDMEGGKIYQIIKEYRPKMGVIVCSGYSLNGPVQEILNAGAQGFIKKPFVFKEALVKIRSVLEVKQRILTEMETA